MIDLTPTARQRFDDYFRQLRQSLRQASPGEAEDVEQSVREHIEVALAGATAPVAVEQLADVLDRLGTPDRWLPAAERPLMQRVIERLRTGPEDWRLAYLAFGLFLAGLILLPVGIGALLIVASYLASRAYVDFMEQKQEVPAGRQWLVYPPIALFLFFAVAFFVVGPAGPVVGWGLDHGGFLELVDEKLVATRYAEARFLAGAVTSIFGAWWILASLIGMLIHPVSRFLFKPLLARVRRTHFLGLTLVGALVLGIGLVLLEPFLANSW